MSYRWSKGFTLAEVVIALLVAAMAVMAMFSVILSTFVTSAKADKKQEGMLLMRGAAETLRAYVSADPANTDPELMLPGTPVGHWSAETGAGWSLAAGAHNISSLLSGTKFQTGSLSYAVTEIPCVDVGIIGLELKCRQVKFTLTYPDE